MGLVSIGVDTGDGSCSRSLVSGGMDWSSVEKVDCVEVMRETELLEVGVLLGESVGTC